MAKNSNCVEWKLSSARLFAGATKAARMMMLVIAALAQAHAGGPKYVAGISYFNPGTMGTPLTWSGGAITYYTDQGNLSPTYPGPSADALVADSFSQWTAISTTAVSAVHGGQLAEDVNGSNVYRNPDGTITMPADIMPTATGTPLGVVYDYDGSVTDAFLGQGAGDSSECFSNAVFGWIDNFAADTYFAHALVVLNGNCLQSSSQQTDVEYRLVRILGVVLGLDWSQVNDNVFTHNPPPTPDDYAGLPVMHAIDPPNCIPITLCYSNPYQPKMDDQAAISRLYPVTAQNVSSGKQIFSASTTRIFGNVYFTNTSGQSAQGMQGVNVVARWIDPSSGQASRAYAAASVSGFLFCGNAGTTVTGFNDATGLPFNRYGSNDTAVEGFFDLAGLQLPNGATSGQYQISVEAIDPMWATTVGPYEPWQVEPSGSAQPIIVNVTLGGNVQQDVLMTGNALQKAAPFPPTTYASPAGVPTGADWTSSLSPYGDLDYFWFSGQANRTLSVLVTALDESGAASMSKAQPVIGMWTLSDPGTYPAPANTPSAFNTAIFGMTMLNAQLAQQTDYRVGIADIRGDGRPDYSYHARILYGDTAQPARASVAGSTPLSVQGLGFESNTTVYIGNTNVVALSMSSNQISLLAPAQADGVQNITLFDPPTGASSIMTGALTYGAGPNDTINLVAGSNPWTPAGGQAPNPIRVQVLAPDGVTPVAGASVFFTSTPAISFSACSGASTCTVITDDSGQASTFVTPLSAGTITVTAQLAPASYSPAKQVQTTLAADSSSLELALVPQTAHIAQGATESVPLTARVLSNGNPLSGVTVNFAVVKGFGTLSSSNAVSNSSGYATTSLQLSSFSSDVQVSVWVAGETNAAPTFYGTAVPTSGLQVRPVAGISQMALEGQSFQPVTVQVTDLSTPPNPVQGASVAFQSTVERSDGSGSSASGGDTTITRNPTPIILASSQAVVISDTNGVASFLPTADGFSGALEVLGTATAGIGNVLFSLQSLPPPAQ
ncbi:MAG TPA: IPT/TIG domain-containing protein [Terriglobales bacterium]|nr:IPT/TIG domain-containing protein [Terriglobales bacterium]